MRNIYPTHFILGAVGANPCVRPFMPGRHAGLPLQFRPEAGVLFFVDFLTPPQRQGMESLRVQ